MFNNVGSKIKTLAKVITVLGIAVSVICAIILMAANAVGPGLLVLVVGILGAWIGSFFAYGFGELVENSKTIADEMRKSKDNNATDTRGDYSKNHSYKLPESEWRCPECGTMNSSTVDTCKNCGKKVYNPMAE